jgi:Ca-activated chloride channel family protein
MTEGNGEPTQTQTETVTPETESAREKREREDREDREMAERDFEENKTMTFEGKTYELTFIDSFNGHRLDRTKFAIDRVVESMKQDRIGVVAFAGEAQVQLPITSDYRMARAFARKLSPAMVRTQGTDLGAAIKLASMSFSSQSEGSRVMILITDGENHESDALEAAQAAAEKGIAIYTIGIGTPEGAPIMIGGDYLTDENGDMVVSKLDEKMLQEIASATGGAYVRATKQSIGLKEIVDRLKELDESDLATTRFEAFDEQYQYPLAVALLLLLVEWLILDRRNPLLARFNIFGQKRE